MDACMAALLCLRTQKSTVAHQMGGHLLLAAECRYTDSAFMYMNLDQLFPASKIITKFFSTRRFSKICARSALDSWEAVWLSNEQAGMSGNEGTNGGSWIGFRLVCYWRKWGCDVASCVLSPGGKLVVSEPL